ncbi:alpha/beta hydrolase family protein [Mycobacterium sp. NPDC051804]|uniref:alpha/beta hydrolase family protein n=1 Tax=Mycobacterium sp. NPDC051804 TaxID=3364295 RepID=UPI003799C282
MNSAPRGGVLILPGGKPQSDEASSALQLANLRMDWLALELRLRFGAGVRVNRVRYRLRGWNGSRRDPVRDARDVLDRMLTDVEPRRIVLVGHSMGGRVAAHLSADSDIGGVVALAPWWPRDDGDLVPVTCRLLVVHGTADTRTDPRASQDQVQRARDRGVDAEWVGIPGAGHNLLSHWSRWHRLTAQFVAQQIS